MNTLFNLDLLVRENVKALKPYSSARDEYVSSGEQMVFLDANENPFENGLNRYPDPHQRNLKQLISKVKQVEACQILVGNGSDEVLDLIFRAFCEPGKDNIITLPPTYGMYKVLSGINNIENREVLLTDKFQPNVDEILAATDENTKLLFLCTPNNPTGNSFDFEAIERLLFEFPGLVVVDEAYIDFATNGSWSFRLNDFPNLIVTQTLSKAFAMAGIRLGLCFASEEIIAVLKKIKPPYNVNELTQQKAFEALENYETVKEQVQTLLKERKRLSEAIATIPYIETIYDSDANFILIKVDDANKRYNQLLEKGIVIRNRSTQPLCENTLRLTVGTIEENDKLISTLKAL
ncbi:histidinol-phosphate transaminase [Croceivirga radicis]|uniref:Histidinol-phosphate aminotransferase n=1 Tax=Croceivirga radicis TaxID=1929488 RepID=A0A1V6LRT7_9FLAO|nr:histidinol-phosphate transaminase [Croceivirga radicis]OQD42892.1 histidinol-phosphate transaminase [Croceivirga radicis]